MNEHEITEARQMAARLEMKNLHRGACVLAELRDWTNRNSDGWPYWALPSRASGKLQGVLEDMRQGYYRAGVVVDITEADLNRVCAPIKAFLTRRGVDHAEVFKP